MKGMIGLIVICCWYVPERSPLKANILCTDGICRLLARLADRFLWQNKLILFQSCSLLTQTWSGPIYSNWVVLQKVVITVLVTIKWKSSQLFTQGYNLYCFQRQVQEPSFHHGHNSLPCLPLFTYIQFSGRNSNISEDLVKWSLARL